MGLKTGAFTPILSLWLHQFFFCKGLSNVHFWHQATTACLTLYSLVSTGLLCAPKCPKICVTRGHLELNSHYLQGVPVFGTMKGTSCEWRPGGLWTHSVNSRTGLRRYGRLDVYTGEPAGMLPLQLLRPPHQLLRCSTWSDTVPLPTLLPSIKGSQWFIFPSSAFSKLILIPTCGRHHSICF